ncbi:MAG: phosphopantothenoylcysteine decarboxylase [Planctomycetes bacterium]|nr:phosphopantothenoylcysteine decarboxylase [Planctomycetota bacterium]
MTPIPSNPDGLLAGWKRSTPPNIFVGVTGGIAAYKTCTVVSRLAQAGAHVTVAMTPSATKFVAHLTFQALSGHPVYTTPWEHIESHDPQHISLARSCDLALIAPITMDTLAKLATGRADDVVTLIVSAIDRSTTPVLLAPSMNDVMWHQPATQRNLKTLNEDGFRFVGPGDGWQACRTVGTGRMAEPEEILASISAIVNGSTTA